MAVRWIVRTTAGAIAAIFAALYPAKVAALGVLIVHALWNIAVAIGEHVHIPGEGKVAASAAAVALLPGTAHRLRTAFSSDHSDHKETL